MNYYEQKRDFHKIQLDIAIAQNKPKAIKLHKTEFNNYSDEVKRQESKQVKGVIDE